MKNLINTLLMGALIVSVSACTKKEGQTGATGSATTQSSSDATQIVTPPGAGGELKIEDEKEGSGPAAASGSTVTVHYTGWLTDGTEFDSSKKPGGQPFTVQLGQHQVIAGWDQGLVGMKKGGTRKLTIPPSMGYGANGIGKIPPNSTLIFKVEMLEVK
jgi:FKBP-type peptidyl-prolyl cis-trans isomerase